MKFCKNCKYAWVPPWLRILLLIPPFTLFYLLVKNILYCSAPDAKIDYGSGEPSEIASIVREYGACGESAKWFEKKRYFLWNG